MHRSCSQKGEQIVAVVAVSPVVAIRKYFFPENTPSAQILAEMKKLTPEDKKELAEGAAKILGVVLAEK